MIAIYTSRRLRCASAVSAVAMSIMASTAFAQPENNSSATDAGDDGNVIIVTGSILKQPGLDTPSPVSVLSAASLEQRSIQTTQDAIQRIPSNNGPALTNAFTANGAFAAGASAVSLRGLSTSSTLVLFDGQRAAYYPLSDDATRNFVDLNTIPDDIVDRVEVLRDGASSTYGADAIAGVVNIITKKEFKGLSARAEAGITERGDGENYRFSVTAGKGDLKADGYNVYVSGFYYRQESLYNRDRPYPYNSSNQSGICNNGVCGPQIGPNGNTINPTSTGYEGLTYGQSDRSLFPTTFFVAPVTPGDRNAGDATLGRYQLLNPTAGCIAGETPYQLTGQNLEDFPSDPTTTCQGDLTNQYGVISPTIERFGATLRATAEIGENTEAYIMFNFLQSKASFTGNPATIRANGPAGIFFPRFSTYTNVLPNAEGSGSLTLPVYICPLVNGRPQAVCDVNNGTLNPNNPFASQGQEARILGRIPNIIEYTETLSRTYRAAFGLKGPLFDKWDFSVEGVGMRTNLNYTQNGNVYIQHLLNVIADGSYNFINPYSNSQATLDYLSPANVNRTHSDLFSIQAIITGELFTLPGGPIQVGFGGTARVESINAPSANSDVNGPTERFFVVNAFGTKGERTVYSGFFEFDAPVIEQLHLTGGGRYDHYSSGQSNFSPKAGFRFEPVKGITLRGTWSRGFRIPSFAEANAVPTTGFVTNTANTFTDNYLAQYGCSKAEFQSCPTYLRASSYGQTTLASPNLQPEKSTSYTAGVILQPFRGFTVTVDYYNIKKTGAIVTPQFSEALAAYYGGGTVPSVFNIIADAPDPNFPNATPRIAYAQAQLINSDTIRSEGLDFAVNGQFNLGSGIRWSTSLEASYIINLSTTFPNGTTQSYEGTAGNNSLTAGSGTPEWHGNWVNTFEYGPATLSIAAEFFGGYNLSAEDISGPGTSGDCSYLGSVRYVPCNVDDYITVDLATSYKINDKFTLYLNVLNLFDTLPPIDPITYGANNYNPVQGGNGIFGRSYRAGVKASF